MVTWPMTSHDHERSNLWPQYVSSAISRKLLEIKTPFQRTTNRKWHMGIKWSRDWWRYVIPNVLWASEHIWGSRDVTVWGSTVGYPSDSLASCWNTFASRRFVSDSWAFLLGFNVRGPDTTSYRQIDWGNNVVEVKVWLNSIWFKLLSSDFYVILWLRKL